MATASLQEKNDKYYVVLNTKVNGKRKQKWISTGLEIKGKGSKREAEKKMREILVQFEANGEKLEEPKVKKDTLFADYMTVWYDTHKEELQTTTKDVYQHMLSKHIYPYFREMEIRLDDLTPDLLEDYYDSKMEEGLSQNTILKHHSLIRTALNFAVHEKVIKDNAADMAKKPKKKKFTGNYFNADELNQLFGIVKDDKIEPVILFTVYYGLRRSEVLGLRWSKIDFVNNIISVAHKVVRTKGDDGKMTISKEDNLKSESSYRDMPLLPELATYLNNLRKLQESNKQLYPEKYNHENADYICVDKYGEILGPDYVSHRFQQLISENALKKIRFHDLRHSCATLLSALGFDMKSIQEWLGHANIQTTANIYAHVDFSRKNEMISKVNETLQMQK